MQTSRPAGLEVHTKRDLTDKALLITELRRHAHRSGGLRPSGSFRAACVRAFGSFAEARRKAGV